MSDSTDNTNELDSYGVWVKNTPKDAENQEFDMTDSIELPDFDDSDSFGDSDFSDMFKDDTQFTSDSVEGDTTLTSDELLNLTSSMDNVPVEETISETENTIETNDFPSIEEPDFSAFETVDETAAFLDDSPIEEEISAEAFMEENVPVEAESFTENETEEVSLDDFVDFFLDKLKGIDKDRVQDLVDSIHDEGDFKDWATRICAEFIYQLYSGNNKTWDELEGKYGKFHIEVKNGKCRAIDVDETLVV